MKGLSVILISLFFWGHICLAQDPSGSSQERRKAYLEQLSGSLYPDYYERRPDATAPTPADSAWSAWQKRTGELPPDFESLPSLPFLPDPLILDEGGENIPVKTAGQWSQKRQWIKEQAQHWITGTMPPPPGNLKATVLKERRIGELTERDILIQFGPDHQARLHITLLIPPGDGPFPVFICPWKKDRYDWVQAAVRRGYMGVRFAATDPKYGYEDDSEAYQKIWWPEYDFTTLGRWAWAVSRTIDYLYSLPYVQKEQIALTGLSRNGKMALWAAAYDERIKAVVPISGGTGGENPFRYTTDKYYTETIELLTRVQPHWLHPRLRFFAGREHKLPVDMNSLMALVAPRGLMFTSSVTEKAGNYFGAEQAYLSAKKVYDFLGAGNKIAIDLRQGLHAPSARDIEKYLDFFDYVFGRGNIKPENRLYADYSFSRWMGLSGETIDPLEYKSRGLDKLLEDNRGNAIRGVNEWEQKKKAILEQVNWALGSEPPSVGPGEQPDYMREVVGLDLPHVNRNISSRPVSFGTLYLPADSARRKDLPVIVYLHEYTYSTGYERLTDVINRFTKEGFAVYMFDQVGFGARIEEGTHFYERFPHWSKLGRMVADVRWAFDELSKFDFLDKKRMFVGGYALGGTVGLYSAALDNRVAGVFSVAGFTPMRTDSKGATAEGIYSYSHLHGLLPRLGFFAGHESRIPYDYHEVLAAIAPRPVLLISPTWDQYASLKDIKQAVDEAGSVYRLYKGSGKIQFETPEDYNRFSPEMKETAVKWAKEVFLK